MLYTIDDTIVAVSSPPGWAARGIVRLSGPESRRIASAVFVAEGDDSPSSVAGFTRLGGRVCLDERRSVPAECYVFRAPHSYTRQDCVELHTVGSPPLLAMLTELAVAAGARLAQPGEFTARAFLAGAMDMTQAEAVAALIAARSDAELRAAQRLKQGALSQATADLADRLADLTALVEADIDFATEPIEFIGPAELGQRLDELMSQLRHLLETAESTERLACLPTVMLLGLPNVGKSSLMNALTGMDRAICSAVAGTTRDVLSAPLALGRGEVVLLDAAGHADDTEGIAGLARQRARAAASTADLICLVVDCSREPSAEVWEPLAGLERPCVVVGANKIDLVDRVTLERRVAELARAGVGAVCPVSATEGTGLAALGQQLERSLAGARAGGHDPVIALTARQRDSLETCGRALRRAAELARDAVETIDCADLLALELREALDALGEVTGAVTTDDLLGRVFASFCIGK
jgi:tRNA modification GTPase